MHRLSPMLTTVVTVHELFCFVLLCLMNNNLVHSLLFCVVYDFDDDEINANIIQFESKTLWP